MAVTGKGSIPQNHHRTGKRLIPPKERLPIITPETNLPAPCPHCGNNVDKYPNRMGRPYKWRFHRGFRKAVNVYIQMRLREDKPIHFSGLCAWLDISDDALTEYQNRKDGDFAGTITRARRLCRAYSHDQLYRRKGNVRGPEFDLRVNHGMREPDVNQGVMRQEDYVDSWEVSETVTTTRRVRGTMPERVKEELSNG